MREVKKIQKVEYISQEGKASFLDEIKNTS